MPNMLSNKLTELQLSSDDSVYVVPNIPAKKMQNALKSFGAPSMEPEDIIILVDDTLFGSAKNGIIITNKKICIKSSFCAPVIIDIDNIKKISHDASKLFINDQEVINLCAPKKNTCEKLFNFLEKNINNDNYDVDNSIMHTDDIPVWQGADVQKISITHLERNALEGNVDSLYALANYYYENKNTN